MEEKYSNYTVKDLNEPTSPLEKFAKKVFDKLIEEVVPPIPSNYTLYFFNMLEEEPKTFKNQVLEILSIEDTQDLEKDLELEKKLKLSFKYSKEILQRTALLYKLTKQLRELLNDTINQFAHLASPKVAEKYLQKIENKIGKISSTMNKGLKEIKETYSKNVEIIKDIESNSMFDMGYGVYNAQYFKKMVENEIKLIKKFKHISTLITIKINENILKNLKMQKSAIVLNRSIAKILLKTSRRSDIVAHLGNGIFAMLLKHTDRIGAEKTIQRLSDIIANSSVFIEGEEVEIKIVSAICEIKAEHTTKELTDKCMKLLDTAQKENKLFVEGE